MAFIVERKDVQKALACLFPAEMSDTTSSRSTSPSQDETVDSPLDGLVDDVWRDLCLMPTPPMSSPEYTQMSRPPSPVSESPTCIENEYSEALMALEMLEKIRALEDASLLPDPQSICEHSELLIQDCMWSGPYGGGIGCKELVGETSTPSITSGHVSEEQPSGSDSDVDPSQQECVEPSAVFPALGTDQRHLLLHHHQTVPRPLGRSSRGGAVANSESEEEIDVVTIEHKADSREASHHHSRTAPEQHPQLTHRKVSRSCGVATTANSFRRKKHSKRFSRLSSHDGVESDDEARRASHNVLERKRRNDLKNSFDILRSRIPELEENQRAPKVIILRKATEYIKAMQVSEKRTSEELVREKARHSRLIEKLAHLKTLRSI